MEYSYKNGLREGVIFLFYKDEKILIEHRPTKDGRTEIFIPNGSIEMRDHIPDQDYRMVALMREVSEEFENKVIVSSPVLISEFSVPAVGLIFHTYAVTEWQGAVPEYSVEEDLPPAKLEWILLSDFRKYLKFESAIDACEALQRYLNNQK